MIEIKNNRYLYKAHCMGLNIHSSLWNIITRIMEFEDVIDAYLQRLENHRIISKKTRKRFLEKLFKELYWEILLEGEATIEGLDYLKEEEEVLKNVIDELRTLNDYVITKKEEERKAKKIIFTPLIVYNVGYSTNNKKNKNRKVKKRSGRPKLIAER